MKGQDRLTGTPGVGADFGVLGGPPKVTTPGDRDFRTPDRRLPESAELLPVKGGKRPAAGIANGKKCRSTAGPVRLARLSFDLTHFG